MRVICPYTTIHPLTEAALTASAPSCERIWVGGSDYAYWQLLADLWAAGESFTIVEHDIEIGRGTLPAFEGCGELWCTFPYNGPAFGDGSDPLLYGSLGCTRFSAVLLAAVPEMMQLVGSIADGVPAGDWRRNDCLLLGHLRQAGFEPHVHWPAVAHHHMYPPYGCACGADHEGLADAPR